MRVGSVAISFTLALLLAASPSRAWGDTVTLTWDPSPDPSVTGYMLYVGTEPGIYTSQYNVGNVSSFVFGDGVPPGARYYFAVAAYAPGDVFSSMTNEVSWVSNAPPVVENPGPQTSTIGQSIVLQLKATDPDGDALTYSAVGLPPGLVLEASTGIVSGVPDILGDYVVTITVSDSVASSWAAFTWAVRSPDDPVISDDPLSGGDVTAPVVTITAPTTWSRYGTSTSFVELAGTVIDEGRIHAVRWVNQKGESGTAVGTTSWTTGVPLEPGRNDITILAVDEAGNTGVASISVFRSGQ